MSAREYNFDGLVGLTHNYGGLSAGNIASTSHGGMRSNPREAALQGLEKMKFVAGLGVGQAVLPPQPRPSLRALRMLGFSGTDEEVIVRAAKENDQLLRLCSSAAAMWTANAATCAPSEDTADGRMHLTPANLQQMFHRAIEAETTHSVMRAIFADERRFAVHAPLPGGGQFGGKNASFDGGRERSGGEDGSFDTGGEQSGWGDERFRGGDGSFGGAGWSAAGEGTAWVRAEWTDAESGGRVEAEAEQPEPADS